MAYYGIMFRIAVSLLILSSAVFPAAAADNDMPAPNWNRAAALAAQDRHAISENLEYLYHLARDGQSDVLLKEVNRIADDPALPAVERDRVLQQLAAALGDFPPGYVDSRILERLATTRARVRVAHEEYPGVGVPLYNIRAAASGSLAQWARAAEPEAPFDDITPDDLIHALAQPGSGHVERIRRARADLSAEDTETVLLSAPGLPDAATASILLAELAPAVIHRPAVVDFLMGLLDDPMLGGTAALALADSNDTATLDRLAEIADKNSGLASRRASLALQSRLQTEAPP
ncbi:MAG: hypothetical protein HKO85_09905 [Xanthomonadales bacterium]|nr:hypothetical protein [Gammaproteobacteria bacterium]NNL05590.1 hypothetical protein [Xanthomonadales bacterium]